MVRFGEKGGAKAPPFYFRGIPRLPSQAKAINLLLMLPLGRQSYQNYK